MYAKTYLLERFSIEDMCDRLLKILRIT